MILASILALVLAPQAGEMRLMRSPDIYGDKVVFLYSGDLWTSDLEGGIARRLTSLPGGKAAPKFSPDGKWIAFTGTFDGATSVYVIPSEGGEPKRLTFDPDGEVVRGWTRDGRVAYTTSFGSRYPVNRLYTVALDGGMPTPTELTEVSDLSYSPDGKVLAYNRKASHSFNWRRYRGGTQGKISFWDFTKHTYSEIPSGREQSWFPMWTGKDVIYVSDKNLQTVNLYKYDSQSHKVTELTFFKDADVRNPSSDGKKVVFERDGFLQTYDIASGKLDTLAPRVLSDMYKMRPQFRRLGGEIRNFTLSPSGKRLAVEARGDIYSVPAEHGETRNLTHSPASRERYPAWSPDGKTIAYLGDATGEWQIYTLPQMGGEPKRINTHPKHHIVAFGWSPDGKRMSYITSERELYVLDPNSGSADLVFQAPLGLGPNDWSPDGKWIVYTKAAANLQGSVWLYDVEAKKSYPVTDGYYRDSEVAFDQAGKYLYFTSTRTFVPSSNTFEFMMSMGSGDRVYAIPLSKDTTDPLAAPADEEPAGATPAKKDEPKRDDGKVKIDLEGLSERAFPLPMGVGEYSGLTGLKDGFLVTYNGQLMKFDFGSRKASPVFAGVGSWSLNPDRTKIAFSANGHLGISDLHPGIDVNSGTVGVHDVAAVIDPKLEYRQMYWEVWRYMRDNFYDRNMVGVDWLAVGHQYEKFLDYVSSRDDLNYVFGQLIGELGTGHAYVFGGESSGVPYVPVASLGVDYEADGKWLRFKTIHRGENFDPSARGPLGAPGINVKEGEYLLAIDGVPVTSAQTPSKLLVDKVDKEVVIKVNDKPTMEGAREIKLRPIGSEHDLRYADWVDGNRKKVEQMSRGKIGYMHVPNTSMEGVIGFLKGFYSQTDKQAWIIDERYNGGGMIPTFFVEFLSRQFLAAAKDRHETPTAFPQGALEGPKAMLINSYAGSGGDLFPWFFREMKLGPLIGTRTWGGLVGIAGSADLLDGGGVTAPCFGIFDHKTGQWIAENKGIDPDIEVDDRPDWVVQGKDAQLEKAVQYLLDELEKGKGRKPVKQAEFPKLQKP